jgi:hypothetical protein
LKSTNETLIVGAPIPAERALEAHGGAAAGFRPWKGSDDAVRAAGSSAGLGICLVELEHELEGSRPAAVLLADASDAALAAAIVAAKLLIPVAAVEAATAGDGVNSRLIAQLAPTYTPKR